MTNKIPPQSNLAYQEYAKRIEQMNEPDLIDIHKALELPIEIKQVDAKARKMCAIIKRLITKR